MVDIARLRQTDDGVDQDVRLPSPRRSYSQFSMCAMHGIASLERDDTAPAKLLEVCAQLCRSVSKGHVIVVLESVDGLEPTTNVVLLGCVEEVSDCRVFRVATKNLLGLLRPR